MKEIRLKAKEIPSLGLEAENISPDVFSNKSLSELKALPVYFGNQEKKLSDFFEIEGEKGEEIRIIIEGDASRVKRIGQDMAGGEILVRGDSGMHLGHGMRGGSISVTGSSGSYLGMDMTGGRIEVGGDVGDYCCSSYVGKDRGISGGEVMIGGAAGVGLGKNMVEGKITVSGNVSFFAGTGMKGGSLEIYGDSAGRLGAEMQKGEIRVHGKAETLPGFVLESEEAGFLVYSGDHADSGEGRIYLKK